MSWDMLQSLGKLAEEDHFFREDSLAPRHGFSPVMDSHKTVLGVQFSVAFSVEAGHNVCVPRRQIPSSYLPTSCPPLHALSKVGGALTKLPLPLAEKDSLLLNSRLKCGRKEPKSAPFRKFAQLPGVTFTQLGLSINAALSVGVQFRPMSSLGTTPSLAQSQHPPGHMDRQAPPNESPNGARGPDLQKAGLCAKQLIV